MAEINQPFNLVCHKLSYAFAFDFLVVIANKDDELIPVLLVCVDDAIDHHAIKLKIKVWNNDAKQLGMTAC